MGGLVAGGVALLVALLLFHASHAFGALYIGTASIGRANLDGSLFNSKFILGGQSVCAIAVDSSHIYWADSYGNVIGRANLDGTSPDYDFIDLAEGTYPCGLAVNSGYLYWPNMGTDTVGRARLDGSELDESFISTVQHPCAIAVDQSSIYWASDDEGQIWRTDIEGANAPELIIDEGATDPCGIALVGSHLFWVESLAGAIGRSNLDGSQRLPMFISGGDYPVSLVAQDGHFYWANVEGSSVGRADLDGSNVNQAYMGGLEHPYALAADSLVVSPPPVVPPQTRSTCKLLDVRLSDSSGQAFVSVYASVHASLGLHANGLKARVTSKEPPSEVKGEQRWWLKVWPDGRGSQGRSIRRQLRRAGHRSVRLKITCENAGELPGEVVKRIVLRRVKHQGHSKRAGRRVAEGH